jgi:Zn-dependent peptidase ImmA (M78 family)
MSHKTMEVSVQPSVIVWARESIGKSIDDVAKKLGTSTEVIRQLETGKKRPTIHQLREMSAFYKRPLAAFLLPNPPAEMPLPADCRTFPDAWNKPFSESTLLAIRRARRVQSLLKELASDTGDDNRFKKSDVEISLDPEKVAFINRIEWEKNRPLSSPARSSREALENWVSYTESLGIVVLQMRFEMNDARGFSLFDDEYPLIVINNRDAYNGRIFSLFHEHAHILLGKTGICDMVETFEFRQPRNDLDRLETFCNHYAGAFLVPRRQLLSFVGMRNDAKEKKLWNEDELKRVAAEFNVSEEVILRRMVYSGIADASFYREKRQEWLDSIKSLKRKGGKRNRPQECIRENGSRFINLVLESHDQKRITFSDVSDYLRIKTKYIPNVVELVSSKS